ncbi:hypothetical protein [Gynuella sunshinyii]|uniref:Uncharacterized protein n=1 Tax=Gynuella sunshinyii YC6258 TaxID=1445510 RepID=A0A0C5VFT7_9GAMM|nr:hypothetical protein [Gynuella sunshinyii]AJQ92233.1 hypothetical Protein YC6258_00181 [Gynuella sunshinyii YC6258]
MENTSFISLERFAQLEGISEGVARGWRDRGYLAVAKTGKHVLVDKELTDMRRRLEAGTLAEYNQLKRYGLDEVNYEKRG